MIYKTYKGSNILGINLGFLFVCYSWPRLFLRKVLFSGEGQTRVFNWVAKSAARR